VRAARHQHTPRALPCPLRSRLAAGFEGKHAHGNFVLQTDIESEPDGGASHHVLDHARRLAQANDAKRPPIPLVQLALMQPAPSIGIRDHRAILGDDGLHDPEAVLQPAQFGDRAAGREDDREPLCMRRERHVLERRAQLLVEQGAVDVGEEKEVHAGR
jgi:hypothetical protein